MRAFYVAIVLGGVLAACQNVETAPKTENVDLEAFATLAEKTFETPEADKDNNIRDRRIRVTSDALEGVWFYTQLNTGAERKLYRQRLSNLTLTEDGTAIIQKTYGLNEPEKYANAWENPDLLAKLTPADFKSYFNDGCEQIWWPQANGAWSGYVDPKTCIISSKRRNKDIRIESEGYLSKNVYRTNERGYDMDMTFLWGTKPGELIELYPLR